MTINNKNRSIRAAMDYFAPTGGIWEGGVASYERQRSLHVDEMLGRRAGILTAVRSVENSASGQSMALESTTDEAVGRYWATYWTQEKEGTAMSPQESDVIYVGNGRDSYVTTSEYDDRPAVTKHGESAVLRRELSILSAVNGIGAPEVYAYTERNNGEAELTMERLEGQPLSSRINLDRKWHSTPLPEDYSRDLSVALIDALQSISDAGYLYRDMNLDHIIIEGDNLDNIVIKLLDTESSLLKDAQGGAAITDHRGTWETMSPEEFQEAGRMTEASLVYAVGVVLSQLIRGENQFFADIPGLDVDQLRKVAEYVHTAYPNPHVSGRTGDVVKKALEPRPEDRPQSLQELRDLIVGEYVVATGNG